MEYIELGINLTDDLGIRSIVWNQNTTKLPCDSNSLVNIAFAILKAVRINKEDMSIQDMLNELNIKTQHTPK